MGSLLECLHPCTATVHPDWTVHECLQSCLENFAEEENAGGLPMGVSIFLAVLLVPLTGLFAGLTLGLLTLDLGWLKVTTFPKRSVLAYKMYS